MVVGGNFGGHNMEECRSYPNVVGPVCESSPFGIQEAISFKVFKEECSND